MVVRRLKSIGATPVGVKLAPQPGASGSVGGPVTTPPVWGAWMLYCVPRMPFEVKRLAKRMAGVRLQKRPAEKRTAVFSSGAQEMPKRGPAEKRTAVFSSGAQEMPKRGESWLSASGMRPLRLYEPLALRSLGF